MQTWSVLTLIIANTLILKENTFWEARASERLEEFRILEECHEVMDVY